MRDLDHGRSTVRTAVRQIAVEQILDQFLHLEVTQRIVAHTFQIVDHFPHKLRAVGHVQKSGQTVDLECVRSKAFDPDSHFLKDRHVLFDPIRVTRRQLERLRNKKFLRGNPLIFHASPQFFEQDPFVRRMLIDQHESVRVLHQHVKFVQ